MIHYFADDGNYGDASDIAIIHTDGFTEQDWQEVEEAPDNVRRLVAEQIAEKKTNITRIRGI